MMRDHAKCPEVMTASSLSCRALLLRRHEVARPPRRRTQGSSGRRCENSSCTLASRRLRNWWRTTPAAAGRAGCLGRASSTSASTTWPSTPSCWERKVCTLKGSDFQTNNWTQPETHSIMSTVNVFCVAGASRAVHFQNSGDIFIVIQGLWFNTLRYIAILSAVYCLY